MRFLHSGLMGCLTLFIAYSTFLLPFLTGEIFIFFQGEDGIRYGTVTGVQTCALPIFVTPSEAVDRYDVRGELSFPHAVSWADTERDVSAWLSNPMQHDAINKLYGLEERVLKTGDKTLIHDWRKLQTSDHFYYMCTKWFADGDVHKYFNPYETPYDAFISFMNVLNDVQLRVEQSPRPNLFKQLLSALSGA